MANNFLQPGDTLKLIAPTGGTTKGVGFLSGSIFAIALDTVAQTLPVEGMAVGVWSHAKTASQAWTAGQVVYWDDTNKVFSNVATVGFYGQGGVFVAVEAVGGGAGDTIGKVRLVGSPVFPLSATYVNR